MNKIFKTMFCYECKKDIPIEELENGIVIVNCPKCVGECLTCDCHLVKECFSDVQNVRVLHPDSKWKDAL